MMLLLVLAVPVKMFSCIFPSSLGTYVRSVSGVRAVLLNLPHVSPLYLTKASCSIFAGA